jgi:hypothetical protein
MKPTDITQEPVLVPENAGTVLNVFGDQFTVKQAGQQTQGVFTLLELITPPGGGFAQLGEPASISGLGLLVEHLARVTLTADSYSCLIAPR